MSTSLSPIAHWVAEALDRNYDHKIDASELPSDLQKRFRKPGNTGDLTEQDFAFSLDSFDPDTTPKNTLAARARIEKAVDAESSAELAALNASAPSTGEWAGWLVLGFLFGILPLLFIVPWLQRRQETANSDTAKAAREAAAAARLDLRNALAEFP